MRVRFMLGPAGSGKTFRCLQEVRDRLARSPEGPPLLFVAPNQTTYQLERQLLSGEPGGYTRLFILSFERLAYQLFLWAGARLPELLDDEGRVMVLRALLARRHKDLKLFHASARLTGFAQHLSDVLCELQQHRQTAESLEQLAANLTQEPSLSYKLQDLAMLLREYTSWLQERKLQDQELLLADAAELLSTQTPLGPHLHFEELWVDGFAQFTGQELGLLASLVPRCGKATLTFCLEDVPAGERSWLRSWSICENNFEAARGQLSEVPGVSIEIEKLSPNSPESRFSNNPVLRHLERHWSRPEPYTGAPGAPDELSRSLRTVLCADPVAEAAFAAREILSCVRAGHRYREIAVLVRNLDDYRHAIESVFRKYQIPYFMDKRQSMGHHPAAELTSNALRTVALGWQHEDWFAALKTGLVPATEQEIDELENEALVRGWQGQAWLSPLRIKEVGRTPEEQEQLRVLEAKWERLRKRLMRPFQNFSETLKHVPGKVEGSTLASALRGLWGELKVEEQLQTWAESQPSSTLRGAPAVHLTVWGQLQSWLSNVELAFGDDGFGLREWLSILEAGLGNLTVGLVPPALDQVLVGAVDRSRNPQVLYAFVLGLNEGVFPALPRSGGLLSDMDREKLQRLQALPASDPRQQLSRERYYGYLACTRAQRRLVLTSAARGADNQVLNPSPFLAHIRRLFPGLDLETQPARARLKDCLHVSELVDDLTAVCGETNSREVLEVWLKKAGERGLSDVERKLGALLEFDRTKTQLQDVSLSPRLASRLYGRVLRTSVSRIEQFAACPFRFFIHSGLRAQERKRFELDAREQGTFQHDLLAQFHDQLRRENKRWRDVTPEEARARVEQISRTLTPNFRGGLLQSQDQSRFVAQALTEAVQDFVEVLVGWMRSQYRFDPAAVELGFGQDGEFPAWTVELGEGRQLELRGRIDRIDLFRSGDAGQALCIVVDYKSSHKQLDAVLMHYGLQLQLLAYMNVLQRLPQPGLGFGAAQLMPAGVFYVNLQGRNGTEANRAEALRDIAQARRIAYRHSGRFDVSVLKHLDSRSNVQQGDQFNFRLTRNGELHKNCQEPMARDEFLKLLNHAESSLREMGRQIYSGVASVSPFRKGRLIACDQCEYQSICRIDPWTHQFRVLKAEPREGP